MRRVGFLLALALAACAFWWCEAGSASTTIVFEDDFGSDTSAAYTTGGALGAGAWGVTASGADWGARRNASPAQLELTNDAGAAANASGWVLASAATASFGSPYNPVPGSNPGLVTWTFNMRQPRADPAGFSSGSYGAAFILAGTANTSDAAGSGYAVVLGQSGAADPVRLARFNGGVRDSALTNIITSNTAGLADFGGEYLSIKVTYDPQTNTWQLFLRNDGASAFADPAAGALTPQGSAVDGTHTTTSLPLMGAWWQGATAANQSAFFDNVRVTVARPHVNVTGGPLTFPSTAVGSASAAQSYAVSGSDLRAGLVVSAPDDFQVSTSSGGGFGPTLTLAPAGGEVAVTTVYVRFAPTSAGVKAGSVTNASDGAITQSIVVSGAAVPTLSVGDVTLPEPSAPAGGTASSYAQFRVALSEASAETVTASFSTADGTAKAPGDYAAFSGVLTFAPGETRKTVAVAVRSDSAPEAPETFALNLSSPSGAALGDGAGAAIIAAPTAPGSVLISEFRLRGAGGADDEFVELYNNTDSEITVADANPLTCAAQALTAGPATPCGWALVDLQGAASATPIPRFVVPAGTTIPARGHYLAAGAGYGLSALAEPDLTYAPPAYGDADFTGLALYKTADRAEFTRANLYDAAGFEGVPDPFREGTGLLPADGVAVDAEHSFVRNQGSGRPADTGDNRADFTLVSTDPSLVAHAGAAVLGAPGPENSAGLVSRNAKFSVGVPAAVASSVRTTSPAVTNGALGTLSLRRRFTNNTGQTLTRLRFRVAEVTTLNGRLVFGSQAELRLLDAQLAGLAGTGLKAAKVETPPAQGIGGGVNTGLLIGGSLTLAQPLPNGQSVDVEFLLGVMRGGSYQLVLNIEAAP